MTYNVPPEGISGQANGSGHPLPWSYWVAYTHAPGLLGGTVVRTELPIRSYEDVRIVVEEIRRVLPPAGPSTVIVPLSWHLLSGPDSAAPPICAYCGAARLSTSKGS